MPKATLKEPFKTLETNIIKTLLNGLHRYRPDLSYPESHSDMQGAVRELMALYNIEEKQEPTSENDIKQRLKEITLDE